MVKVKETDLRCDMFTNIRYNSGIKVTHVPSGIIVYNDSTKYRSKNRKLAIVEIELKLNEGPKENT